MTAISELGPLWDREPKILGLRFAIPGPMDLYNWAITQASAEGDLTREQIIAEQERQFEEFLEGRSQRFISFEREWQVNINDNLLSHVHIELAAAYSPKGGEWATIKADVDYSQTATELNHHYTIPSLSPQIAHRLISKGFKGTYATQISDIQHVIVPGSDECTTISIATGFLAPEAAATLDPESDPEEMAQLGIIVRPEETLPLNLTDMLKVFQQFQYVLSHTVDSIYEVIGITPPNVKLVLSSEQELL